MSNSYKKTEKLSFFKRMFSVFDSKQKMLEAPNEYTQKEIKLILEQIIYFLRDGYEFSLKEMGKIQRNANSINIYFYNAKDGEIENNLDTYVKTVGKEKIKVYTPIFIKFHNPICYKGNIFEVFPNLNVTKISNREKYIMKIYLNLVKGISRGKSKILKFNKESYHIRFFYGLNFKDVVVKENKISRIRATNYSALNETFAYIVAQFLYERIERRPFTLELSSQEEKQVKRLKFCISNCYYNIWDAVKEYLTCNEEKIKKRFKRIGFESLASLNQKIKE